MGCPLGQPFTSMELLSLRSAYGTSVCTSTAISALFCVDNVNSITLSDSLAGALISACTACYAIFFSDMHSVSIDDFGCKVSTNCFTKLTTLSASAI